MKNLTPKQLTMKRPKQRNIIAPRYAIRIDFRKKFPYMPRARIYKYTPGGVRHDEGGKA